MKIEDIKAGQWAIIKHPYLLDDRVVGVPLRVISVGRKVKLERDGLGNYALREAQEVIAAFDDEEAANIAAGRAREARARFYHLIKNAEQAVVDLKRQRYEAEIEAVKGGAS